VTISPTNSTIFDTQSTNQPIRITQVSSLQRKAINNPLIGSMVFDTDHQTIFLFDGKNWNPMLFSTSINNIPPVNRMPSDGITNKVFGFSVAFLGDNAIIDSYMDNGGKGSAYIYTKQNGVWIETQKITPNDLEVGDFFGESVAISNDYAVIGCKNGKIGSNYYQGTVYVFIHNNNSWNQEAKLIANDGSESDNFGKSVAIFNDRIIVGASSDDVVSNADQGSAYIFTRISNTWT
jgi:hypothetical protein